MILNDTKVEVFRYNIKYLTILSWNNILNLMKMNNYSASI